jgi:hypothetical protein
LSLLGVNNINGLKECTKVLPNPTRGFNNRDQARLSTWLDSDDNSSDSKKTSDEVNGGDEISTAPEEMPGWNHKSTHRFKGHGHGH